MPEQVEGRVRLKLAEPLTLRSVGEARVVLLRQFAEAHDVELELASNEADCAGVQLIESARSYARSNGKQLRLAFPAAGSLRELLDAGGFLAGSSDNRAFWLHEGAAQ